MKQKNQQNRKKKRSCAAKPSGDEATSDGSKKDLEEERKEDDEGNKEIGKVEKKYIESLMEAFCSVSMEEASAAYKESGGDLNKAAEILSDLVESGDDPSTSSVASGSSGMETASTSDYGAGSSSSCSDDLTRDRWIKGNKQNRVIAATGMVSSVIAKDYLKPNTVWKELPMVERSKELCGSGKKAADREKAEQFLSSMLGDDCELSMAVVRDVLCQCGYDVDMVSRLSSNLHGGSIGILTGHMLILARQICFEALILFSSYALNILLDMSSSSTDDSSLRGKCFGVGFNDSLAETSFDTDTSESELFWGDYSRRDYAKVLTSSEEPFATSQGSYEQLGLPQKVLESLFNIRQSPKHEPKTMSWRNVAKKMQSLGIDASSSSGEEHQPNTSVKDDGYHELRKGATDQWNVTKSYYQKAAEAYSKGGRAHAAYLSDKGRAASKVAQRADDKASQDIFVARNKDIENVVTIDLHGQHVKQAMKLLKLHLLFGSYVPSIQTLRVITGCGSHGFGKSKVKQSVIKLLEREGVRYCEENRGTLLIKLDGCSREFSFLDTESDCE